MDYRRRPRQLHYLWVIPLAWFAGEGVREAGWTSWKPPAAAAIAAAILGYSMLPGFLRSRRIARSVAAIRERRLGRRRDARAAEAARRMSADPGDLMTAAVARIDAAVGVAASRAVDLPGADHTIGCREQCAAVADGACRVPRRVGDEETHVEEVAWSEHATGCSAVVVRARIETRRTGLVASREELWELHRRAGGRWQLGVCIEAADHAGFPAAPAGAGRLSLPGLHCVHETRDAGLAAFWRFVRAARMRSVEPLAGLASHALRESLQAAWAPGRAAADGFAPPSSCRVNGAAVVGASSRGDVGSAVVEITWTRGWDDAAGPAVQQRSYVVLERSLTAPTPWTLVHFAWCGDEVIADRIESALDAARAPLTSPAGVVAWAVAVAAADGAVSHRERVGVLRLAAAAGISAEDATNLLAAASEAVNRGRPPGVPAPRDGSVEEAREWLRRAMCIAIDGGVTREEHALLARLGATAGMEPADVRRFLDDVVAEELAAARDPSPRGRTS